MMEYCPIIKTMQYINQIFSNRWIGRQGLMEWPARPPDLKLLALWGYVKNITYKNPGLSGFFYLRSGCCHGVCAQIRKARGCVKPIKSRIHIASPARKSISPLRNENLGVPICCLLIRPLQLKRHEIINTCDRHQ